MDSALRTLHLGSMLLFQKRKIKKHIIQEALTDRTWVKDIEGAVTVGAIVDFLQL
jgi:hypothetical protein